MKNRYISAFAASVLLMFLCACHALPPESETPSQAPADTRTVVLSLYNDNNPWPIALAKDLDSAAKAKGIGFSILNAQGSAEKQLSDVEALDPLSTDMLLLATVDKDIGAECLSVCKGKGIPVLLVARNADGLMGKDYISLIACDYEMVGYVQGMSLIRLFGSDGCRIVELAGDPSASNTSSIAAGFRRAIESYPQYRIVTTKNHNYSTREALDAMESVIQSNTSFQVVFCHSDADALGVIQALKTAGLTPGCDPSKGDIIITSNCGFEDAIKAVATGELYNTIDLNARIGGSVISIAERYWDGESINPRILVTFREITAANASEWIGKGY